MIKFSGTVLLPRLLEDFTINRKKLSSFSAPFLERVNDFAKDEESNILLLFAAFLQWKGRLSTKKQYMKKIFFSIFLLVILSYGAMAQNKINLSGRVLDTEGLPVIGAGVMEEGTTNGVTTDLDGHFQMSVSDGAVLEISSVGYLSERVTAHEGEVNVILIEDVSLLEEVVVIGYGVQKKSSVTGAISQIKSTDIHGRSISDAQQALQGKTSGVQVLTSSAAPGSSPIVRVRGYSSNSSSDPLYVVDGLRTSSIASLNPEDIESMEVLKDAASAAIYGAEAGNGVVLITTKKASRGEAKITYDYQLQFERLSHVPKVLNAHDYVTYEVEGGYLSPDRIISYWDGKTDTDWAKETFGRGIANRHNLSFTGANDRGSLYASLSYLDEDGPVVQDNDTYKRLTAAINAEYKIKSWLTFSSSNHVGYTHSRSVMEGGGPAASSVIFAALTLDPLTPVVYEDGKIPSTVSDWISQGYSLKKDENGRIYSIPILATTQHTNPYVMNGISDNWSKSLILQGSSSLDFHPIEGLNVISRAGYRYMNSFSNSVSWPYVMNLETRNKEIVINAGEISTLYYQWENFATYDKAFDSGHHIGAMVGMSFSRNGRFNVNGGIRGTDDLGITKNDPLFAYLNYQTGSVSKTVSGGELTEGAKLSYFGRLNYEYKEKIFVQASLRADAADLSVLPLERRWGYFPAVSLGWVLTKEGFMKGQKVFDHLKLRASWGQNGSVAGLGNYMYASAINSDIRYPFSDEATYSIGSIPSYTGNEHLKWETSEQTDLGLDAHFLGGRLTFSADYYVKKTKDLIVSNIASSLIVGNTLSPINAGNIRNSGVELELGWKDTVGDFYYGINGNLSTIRNEVTYIPESVTRIGGSYIGAGVVNYFEKGYPIWYMRGYQLEGIDPQNGDPVFADLDGDGSVGENDMTSIGSGIPDFTYGVTLTMSYKGFDFSLFGSGSHGADILLANMRSNTMQENIFQYFYDRRWTHAGQTGASFPAASSREMSRFLYSSGMVFDGSYFKIKQLQLGYTLPMKKILPSKNVSARFYISMDNWFCFTSYPGFDPEIVSLGSGMGVDMGGYPTSRKTVFGFNLTF